MRDHVVQLARDPRALVGHAPVAFGLGELGTDGLRARVTLAAAQRAAHDPRTRQEDVRGKDIARVAAEDQRGKVADHESERDDREDHPRLLDVVELLRRGKQRHEPRDERLERRLTVVEVHQVGPREPDREHHDEHRQRMRAAPQQRDDAAEDEARVRPRRAVHV
jgi:hypothetical protein